MAVLAMGLDRIVMARLAGAVVIVRLGVTQE
jgi:hypothetical protein